MKLSVVIAAVLGLVVATGLIAYFGVAAVLTSLVAIGWVGFAVFVGYGLIVYLVLGSAWWSVAPGQGLRRIGAFIWGRMVRESASDVLPLSALGGVVIGARALAVRGVEATLANASLAVDLVTEILAQIAFMALGLGLLVARLSHHGRLNDPLITVVILGLLFTITGAAVFVAAQQKALRLLHRMAQKWFPSAADNLNGVSDKVAEIYQNPLRLTAGVVLHSLAWIASAIGSWIALRLMGVHISVMAVIAIESLLSTARSAAFMVPNAVGVQEGGYALIGVLFGLSPETALALSLLKRARDLAIGVPTLLLWQVQEGRRLMRWPGRSARRAQPTPLPPQPAGSRGTL
jgi:putative membrane protein